MLRKTMFAQGYKVESISETTNFRFFLFQAKDLGINGVSLSLHHGNHYEICSRSLKSNLLCLVRIEWYMCQNWNFICSAPYYETFLDYNLEKINIYHFSIQTSMAMVDDLVFLKKEYTYRLISVLNNQ